VYTEPFEERETNLLPGFDLTIGGIYLLNKNFGFYSEIGIAKAIYQLGFVLRVDPN